MPQPIIDARDLTRTFSTEAGDTYALRGVSLTVDPGEFVAIMGPSGSGKSTLMHILGCLDSPTGGSYRLNGEDVSELEDDDLAEIRAESIGFVFQSFNLLPRSTVIRNVMLPLMYTGTPHDEREDRAIAAMSAVGLDEGLFFKRSNELSGGQMQRVAIARALVNDPALILADEPTGNLDTATGEIVMRTLLQLREQGRTIVLITHEPEIGERTDRIVYIRDGLVVSS